MIRRTLGALGACLIALPALAASYDFNVLYSGNGNAVLGAGDDPVATSLVDGDTFAWRIAAQAGERWTVMTGGDFFPLMAFGVEEAGERTGNFTLTLRYAGSDVFSLSETAAVNTEVHLGTNTVGLATGLHFDEMRLAYSLTQAIELADAPGDTDRPPILSSPRGLLPIFGAPEQTALSSSIIYGPVPETGTWAMLLLGLAATAHRVRGRRG